VARPRLLALREAQMTTTMEPGLSPQRAEMARQAEAAVRVAEVAVELADMEGGA
jgi:hypothetical protein